MHVNRIQPVQRNSQRGVLMLVTLVILLVISLLGMATVDTTGIEMQMASNSRQQQEVFEAAEYTLSWVENTLDQNNYFSATQLTNQTGCNTTCFTSTCTNGYCFSGTGSPSIANIPTWTTATSCVLTNPATPFHQDSAIWATGSGRHRTLTVPSSGLTTKYIIEYRCHTTRIDGTGISGNAVQMYRITTLATSEDGRSRVMLRSSMKAL